MRKLTQFTAHRPWPLPRFPWVMAMRWERLLLAHWPVPTKELGPFIPSGMTLDTYDGKAWLSVVPFRMRRIHLRSLFAVPGLSTFLELNVRTYVTVEDKPGIFFFSLDAANPVGVLLGRRWYRLPYFLAAMSNWSVGTDLHFTSRRVHRHATPAEFSAVYRPNSEAFAAQPDTLDYFLVERYCLYTIGRNGRLYRGEIHHRPWSLHTAEADILQNTIMPVDLPAEPQLFHYVEGINVIAWSLRRVNDDQA